MRVDIQDGDVLHVEPAKILDAEGIQRLLDFLLSEPRRSVAPTQFGRTPISTATFS